MEPPPAKRRRRRWRRDPDDREGQSTRGRKGGSPDAKASEQERIILDALADLRDMDVREVMTPRVDVTYLTIPVHADDIAQAVRTSGHSCFPVVHDDLDDLIGILFVNDIFRTGGSGDRRNGGRSDLAGQRERDATDPSPLEISRKVRPPHLVPESLGVLEALADLRKAHRAVAVVVDEYGGVAGLLTVKDLLEPLVGDLHDEFDEEEEPVIVRVDNTRWLIDGQTNVDEIRDRLGMDIPEGEYVTLGGLLFERFGHIPAEGEEVRVGDWTFRVVEMDKRRVAQVVATFVGAGEGAVGGGGAAADAGVGAGAGAAGGPEGSRRPGGPDKAAGGPPPAGGAEEAAG
jgi:magnesium and cobalt transporter